MSLVRNEQTKLTANLLNTVAAAVIAAGAVTPIVAYYYGFGGTRQDFIGLLVGTIIWFSTGLALHFAGRRLLRRLKP